MVVRAADDSLWRATCDGDICGPFSGFPGRFGYQPTVTWDESLQKWVIVGTASDHSIWRGTFNKDGNFNNDWQNISGSTPSPVGISGISGSPAVYDASDQFLGYLQDRGDNMKIYVPSLKKIINIDTNDGESSAQFGLWFESAGCTGQPYSETDSMYRIQRNAGKYYAGKIMAPITTTNNSYLLDDGSCMTNEYPSESLSVEAIVVTLPFTTPVTIPMRLE